MQNQSLKEKTAKGLFWGGLSNGVQQMLNLLFGIFLARLLSPADYGMVGMITIFSALAGALQEGGFIAALTNIKQVTHKDYNAVFWFCSIIGLSIYGVLFLCAPYIAAFYHQPELTSLARFIFLGFVISNVCIAPTAYQFKNIRAKENAITSFTALVISGIIGVVMAYHGCSYWGIATQSILYISVVAVLRYYYSGWRPTLEFDFSPIRKMIGFGSKLVITNIFNIINSNLFSVLLGKFYSEREVGFYTQGNKWNNMGVSTINSMLNVVTQPTLSTLTNEKERQLYVLRKLLRFTALVAFPTMFGLSLVSQELITLAITDKWLQSAQYMQILCIGGAFLPISNLLSNLMISRGHSDIYMWNTILLSLLQIASAFLAYPYGIDCMIYLFVGINILWIFVWLYFAKREIGLTLYALGRDILPYLLLSAALVLMAYYVTLHIEHLLLCLVLKISIVGSLYIAVLWVLKSVILREAIGFLLHKKL